MQLMKQNGIQVNNNNSNSAERLSAQQHSPKRVVAQARGVCVCEGTALCQDHYYDIDLKELFHMLERSLFHEDRYHCH